MPKSKTDKSRKDKLNNYKQTKKMNKTENQAAVPQQANPNQLSPVREVPVWKSTDTIEMKGIEFETLYNGVNEMNYLMQGMFAACQAILQRNLVNGTIGVNFEKLVDKTNPEGQAYQDYEMMSEEEAAPHRTNFNELLEGIRGKVAEAMANAQISQEGVPSIHDIVDADGNVPGVTPKIVDPSGRPVESAVEPVDIPVSDN